MNDADWMKKRRRQPGGGCTMAPLLVVLAVLAVLLG